MIQEPEHIWVRPGVRFLPDTNNYPEPNGHDRPDHNNDLIQASLPAVERELMHDEHREGRYGKLHK